MGEGPATAENVVESLAASELEFLEGLVAGQSQATLASRLNLTHEQALAVRQSLMRKIGAACTADAVRVGIYAGL